MASSTEKFCPELLGVSPPFSVKNGESVISQQTLDLFDALSLPGCTTGVLAFVGGPAYALDWNPDDSHLAVGVHRAANPVHQLMQAYQGAAHLQIWSVQPGARSMAISHLIPHNGDCAWDLKWRPRSSANISTLAAALGNGQVVLYHLAIPLVNAFPNAQTASAVREPIISQSVPQICLRGPYGSPDTVRALQWSPKGDKLAAGTVHGCIELYRVIEDDTAEPCVIAQLIVRVRAHESAISSIRWLDANMLCSAGLDGTQRVRDVRDCLTELERVTDGPAWNLSLVNPEDHVIISGSDSGVLRIARLGTMSSTAEASEMKKTRVSLASLRDLAVLPYHGSRGIRSTALFLGGGEGKLTVGPLPCPLWRPSGCMIRKTRFRPVLQWVADSAKIPEKIEVETVKDEIQKQGDVLDSEMKEGLPAKGRWDLYRKYHSPLLLRLTDTVRSNTAVSSRKNSKKGYPTIPAHVNLCAEKYDQRVAITRLALSSNGLMIATGNHAGFLTVLPVSDDMVLGPSASALSKKTNAKLTPLGSTPRSQKKPKIPVKVEVAKKKLGRPRKYPRPNSAATSPVGKGSERRPGIGVNAKNAQRKTRQLPSRVVQSGDGESNASVPVKLRVRNGSVAENDSPATVFDEAKPVVPMDDGKPERKKRGRPRKKIVELSRTGGTKDSVDLAVPADSFIIPLKLRIRNEPSQNSGGLTKEISPANAATMAARRRGRPLKKVKTEEK